MFDSTEKAAAPKEFPPDFFDDRETPKGTKVKQTSEEGIKVIKQCTQDINNLCAARGEFKLAIARQLVQIKGAYVRSNGNGKGNWLNFLKGGFIGVSYDSALNLVSGWENWLGPADENGKLPPNYVLDSWADRTIQIVGQMKDDNRRQALIEQQKKYLASTKEERKATKMASVTPGIARQALKAEEADEPMSFEKTRKSPSATLEAIKDIRKNLLLY